MWYNGNIFYWMKNYVDWVKIDILILYKNYFGNISEAIGVICKS